MALLLFMNKWNFLSALDYEHRCVKLWGKNVGNLLPYISSLSNTGTERKQICLLEDKNAGNQLYNCIGYPVFNHYESKLFAIF